MRTLSTFALLLCALVAEAQIDFTKGVGTSTVYINQSFNETRSVDVTVISPSINITSATLKRFNVGVGPGISDSAIVGFRLYHSGSRALLAKYDTILYTSVFGGSFTFPVSYTLDSGDSYRVSFFLKTFPDTTSRGSGDLFAPSTLSYTEATNHLRVNAYYGHLKDSFPDIAGFVAISYISLNYQPSTGIGELTNEAPVSIFPNPVVNTASIMISTPTPYNGTLLVYNSLGQEVQKLQNIKTNETNTIYRNGLPAGLYFLRFVAQEELISSGKIIFAD